MKIFYLKQEDYTKCYPPYKHAGRIGAKFISKWSAKEQDMGQWICPFEDSRQGTGFKGARKIRDFLDQIGYSPRRSIGRTLLRIYIDIGVTFYGNFTPALLLAVVLVAWKGIAMVFFFFFLILFIFIANNTYKGLAIDLG